MKNVNEINAEKRTDLTHVDPRVLRIIDGFNVRTDMGDIEALKDSIAAVGVKNPITGYRGKDEDGEKVIFITDGHRRTTAIMKALEEGVEIARVPIILEKKDYTETDRIIDMLVRNEGKPLSQYEQAVVFKKLRDLGWETNEIATKTGKHASYVSNSMELLKTAPKIQQAMAKDEISPSAVKQIVKSTDNVEEQVEKVEKAIKTAKEKSEKTGKKKRATTKDTDVSNKVIAKSVEKALFTVQNAMDELSIDTEGLKIIDLLIELGVKEDVKDAVNAVYGTSEETSA